MASGCPEPPDLCPMRRCGLGSWLCCLIHRTAAPSFAGGSLPAITPAPAVGRQSGRTTLRSDGAPCRGPGHPARALRPENSVDPGAGVKRRIPGPGAEVPADRRPRPRPAPLLHQAASGHPRNSAAIALSSLPSMWVLLRVQGRGDTEYRKLGTVLSTGQGIKAAVPPQPSLDPASLPSDQEEARRTEAAGPNPPGACCSPPGPRGW